MARVSSIDDLWVGWAAFVVAPARPADAKMLARWYETWGIKFRYLKAGGQWQTPLTPAEWEHIIEFGGTSILYALAAPQASFRGRREHTQTYAWPLATCTGLDAERAMALDSDNARRWLPDSDPYFDDSIYVSKVMRNPDFDDVLYDGERISRHLTSDLLAWKSGSSWWRKSLLRVDVTHRNRIGLLEQYTGHSGFQFVRDVESLRSGICLERPVGFWNRTRTRIRCETLGLYSDESGVPSESEVSFDPDDDEHVKTVLLGTAPPQLSAYDSSGAIFRSLMTNRIDAFGKRPSTKPHDRPLLVAGPSRHRMTPLTGMNSEAFRETVKAGLAVYSLLPDESMSSHRLDSVRNASMSVRFPNGKAADTRQECLQALWEWVKVTDVELGVELDVQPGLKTFLSCAMRSDPSGLLLRSDPCWLNGSEDGALRRLQTASTDLAYVGLDVDASIQVAALASGRDRVRMSLDDGGDRSMY